MYLKTPRSVSAQAFSTCCKDPQLSCQSAANNQQQVCDNNCNGNSACIAQCQTTYKNSIGSCNASYNSCLANGKSTCSSYAQTQCFNQIVQSSYNDSCPEPSCSYNCGEPTCQSAPPACPTPVCSGGTWACESPIVIDVNGKGFHLTSLDNGVFFDFFGKGTPSKISWTDPDYSNAWLVLDRNGNGLIDNATELFGNLTPQPKSDDPNGFLALAQYDLSSNGGNEDGFIDSQDAIYDKLRLWIDSNHNGISEAEELHTLASMQVTRLDLQFTENHLTDQYGNVFRYRARIWDVEGKRRDRWTYDVFLQAKQ